MLCGYQGTVADDIGNWASRVLYPPHEGCYQAVELVRQRGLTSGGREFYVPRFGVRWLKCSGAFTWGARSCGRADNGARHVGDAVLPA